jgi:hypothetical protein
MPQSDKYDSRAGKKLYPTWSEKLADPFTGGLLLPNEITAPGTLVLSDQNRLRIPRDMPLHCRQDELMGRNSWSTMVIRPNGLPPLEIESKYFVMISNVCGSIILEGDGEKLFATRRDEIVCCCPGRFKLDAGNSVDPTTLMNFFVFSPSALRLWLSCGYIFNCRRILENNGEKLLKSRWNRFVDPFTTPAGVYAFCMIRDAGFLGDEFWAFTKFLKNGDPSLSDVEFGDSAMDVTVLPHLDIIESRRRKTYPDLRQKMLNYQGKMFYRPPMFSTPEQLKSYIRSR